MAIDIVSDNYKEEASNTKYCLDNSKLELLVEDVKLAKVINCIPKVTSEGDPFLLIKLKDIKGKPITGRIFGDIQLAIKNKFNTYAGSICVIKFIAKDIYGKVGLDVLQITKPSKVEMAQINEEMFCGVTPLLNSSVDNLDKKQKAMTGETKVLCETVFNSAVFGSLRYESSDELLAGANGCYYVLLSMIWDNLEIYHKAGLLTDKQFEACLTSFALVEVCIRKYNETKMAYVGKVSSLILKLLAGCKVEYMEELSLGYLNLRLGIPTDNVDGISKLMYTVYTNTYKTLTVINGYKESIQKPLIQ